MATRSDATATASARATCSLGCAVCPWERAAVARGPLAGGRLVAAAGAAFLLPLAASIVAGLSATTPLGALGAALAGLGGGALVARPLVARLAPASRPFPSPAPDPDPGDPGDREPGDEETA